MSPKKVVPVGADDIIELTDIVESGVLPNDSGGGLTDASFEDTLDSMLADAPELAVAGKKADAAPEMGAAPHASSIGDEDLADLDSLLDDLGDDLTSAPPPAPKAGAGKAASDDVLLDVDDLLAEGAAPEAPKSAPAPAADTSAEIDAFMAEFSDAEGLGAATQAQDIQAAANKPLDGASIGADELLAELQAPEKEASEGDDLLAELESVMGVALAAEAQPESAPAPEPAPEVDPFEMAAAAVAAPAPEVDPFEMAAAAVAAPTPEPAPEADPFEMAAAAAAVPAPAAEVDPFEMAAAAAAAPAPEPVPEVDPFEAAKLLEPDASTEADAAGALTEEMASPAVEDIDLMAVSAAVPDAGSIPLGDDDLQHLDALLDDILQPGGAPAPAAPALVESEPAPAAVEPEPAAAAEPQPAAEISAEAAPEVEAEQFAEPEAAPESTELAAPAPPVDSSAIMADLLAEDGPVLTAVREMVAQELEARMTALEERLAANLDKTAAKAAAKVIREEITALMQDME